MLTGYHVFLSWPYWPALQTRGAIYKKLLLSHACFQLNSNQAIAKMQCYKDLVQFLQTQWLYNACSSTAQLFLYPCKLLTANRSLALFKTSGHKQTATSMGSRGKYCCLRGKLNAASLAGGKTRNTMAVIRSKNAKTVELYYLAVREGRFISNK